MSKLIAKSTVLYQSRMYAPGDPLPAHDTVMRDAWLEAGTAVLVDDPDEVAEVEVKAKADAEAAEAEAKAKADAEAAEAEAKAKAESEAKKSK